MRTYFLLLFLVFTLPTYYAGAQFYEYGQDPASIKWKYINTKKFKVIFPEGFGDEAGRVLTRFEQYSNLNSAQLHHTPGKIPIVLHTAAAVSNGFVVWAPKRVELFSYPDVNGYGQDWYSQLAIHEFRHVIQVDKLRQGVTRALTIAVGEQGIGPAVGMIPFWFLEGDAVYAETNLSQTGRGRLPSFEMKIKAQLLSDKKWYSFSKSYLGSYRDYVPDYYQYGYQMVSYARDTYGQNIWAGALDYVGRKPYLVNPLYFYLNRETGNGKTGLYRNTMNFLRDHWRETAGERTIHDPKPFNSRKNRTYTSWNYPQLLPDSSVIAVKSGLDDIQRFVRIFPNGREQRLFTPGVLASGRISVNTTSIVWDEYVPGLRWSNRSYSVLREYNFVTRKSRTLSRHSRLSSPGFSTSGDTIVAVETTPDNTFFLVLLSPAGGHIFSRIPSPANVQLQNPAWISGTGQIVALGVDHRGKTLLKYDTQTARWDTLMTPTFVNISNPVSSGRYIIFDGTYTGVDDLYALDMQNGTLKKITRARFGAFQPSVDQANNRLAWSYYTKKGYDIGIKDLDPGSFYDINTKQPVVEQPFFSYHDSAARRQAAFVPPPVDTSFKIKNYSRPGHLFHFHSWSPFWFDYTDPNIDNPVVSPGITLLSQNILSTAVTSLGYEYRNGDHYLHSHFIYKGWVPVFDLSATWGGFPAINQEQGVPIPASVSTNLTYAAKTYVPLTFNTGKMVSGAQPSLRLSYNGTYFYYAADNSYKRGMFLLEPRLYMYTYLRTSRRDIQPRWGLTLDGSVVTSPFDTVQLGNKSLLTATAYLPGIGKHHGLRLQASVQRQNPRKYIFNNSLSFPRGYNDRTAQSLNRISADYVFPLAYPDLDLAGLLYLKRIKGDLFLDILSGSNIYRHTDSGTETIDATYRSYGGELTVDYHVFRFLVPLESGVRVIYLQNENRFVVEGVFSVNLGFF
ncbi:MAG TPA: hypothetical protein VE870_01410 [Bacteroidales bacterium]|nr:hypothetical protein [Bacteroidales bacterium]